MTFPKWIQSVWIDTKVVTIQTTTILKPTTFQILICGQYSAVLTVYYSSVNFKTVTFQKSFNLLMHRPSLMRALKCLYFFTITFTPVLKVIIYLMTDLVRQLIVRGLHRRHSTNFTAFLN